jgi:hydroxymethylpyrimidine/phosphomethylpyrimidine kinase
MQQFEAIFSDIGCDAIKIGMLYDSDTIEALREKLSAVPPLPIVLDPVMCAKEGSLLLKPDAIHSLKTLFPLSLLITPNLMEASTLLGCQLYKKAHMEKAALDLLKLGANNVLLKGGHLLDEPGSDCLCLNAGEIYWIEQPCIHTQNTHGTGCTLSSAIAALLARQYPLKEAVMLAKQFLHASLLAGAEYQLGSGCGPLHHFHEYWSELCAL